MKIQTNVMMIKMTKISYLMGTLLLVGCVSSIQNLALNKEQKPESTVSTTPEEPKTVEIIHAPQKVSERPVDVAPLVSNYLAAKFSEHEGRVADAAFFYDRAEVADPENKNLKEKAFSLQLALGNMEEAIRLSKEMITKKDPAPISYILLGADALNHNQLDDAKRYFEQAKSISPMLLQFHVVQAYIDLEEGKNIDEVMAKIKKLPPMEGLTAVRHYHMGRLYEKAGKLDMAQREYEFSLETDAGSSFTVMALERLYHKTNQPEKIQHAYDMFLKSSPDNVMLNLSEKRLKENAPYEKAEPTLQQDVSGLVFELSTLMSAQKLNLAAAQLIHTSLLLDENNDFYIFYKGMLEEQNGAYETAIQTYNSISKDQNTWLGGQIRISDIYNNQGKKEKAIQLIESLQKENKQPILNRILAEMYYADENYAKAIELYDSILSQEPEDVSKAGTSDFWMYFARGTAYERLKQYDKAEEDLMKSLTLQPNNPTALNYLGYMWLERDQHLDEAFSLIGKALVMRPNDAAILDSMGWVLYKKGEYSKAAIYLERAAEKLPDDATISMHLGDVYEKLNRLEEAYLNWQRALKLEPETQEDVKHIQEKLNKVSAKLKK